jgi:hypothetical protein
MNINHRLRLSAVAFVAYFLMPFVSKAQNEGDLAEFLQAKKEDASNLIGAYMSPMIKGISYGMSQGWYHTAKAHKTLGFDLGVSVHVVNIPKSEYYFDPGKFLSPSTTLTVPASGKAPTIMGPKTSTVYTSTYDPDGAGPIPTQTFDVNGPEGLDMKDQVGMSAVLVPMAQLGIGIYKNTDLKIRFVPKTEFGSSRIQMLGFGVLHDIKQHIPGIKLLPFDLSMLAAFNTVKGATSLEGGGPAKPAGYDGPQEMNYKFNSWVIQALISKKFSVLTLYAGAGYCATKSNFNVVGEYEIVSTGDQAFVLKNPVSLKYNDAKSARLTGGLRLKFGPLYLNGEYTLQKYNTYSVGLGFSVR